MGIIRGEACHDRRHAKVRQTNMVSGTMSAFVPPDQRGWGRNALKLCSFIAAGYVLCCLISWAKNQFVAVLTAFEGFDAATCCTTPHIIEFSLVSLAMWVPLIPQPFVLTLWCLAMGYVFKLFALVLLTVLLCLGIPLSFSIGRLCQKYNVLSTQNKGHPAPSQSKLIPAWALEWFRATSSRYIKPMRSALLRGPRSFSFCLMWVPFPANMLPFIVGLLFTPAELRWRDFLLGAIISKWIHFTCFIVIGMEASSLASALAHGEGADGEEASWLKVAAVAGSLVLTVAVFGYMVIVMKRETKMMDMDSGDIEGGAFVSGGLTNPFLRDIMFPSDGIMGTSSSPDVKCL